MTLRIHVRERTFIALASTSAAAIARAAELPADCRSQAWDAPCHRRVPRRRPRDPAPGRFHSRRSIDAGR